MKNSERTQLRFGMLTLFVLLAFALISSFGTYAQAQTDPAFPDDLTYWLNGNNLSDVGTTNTYFPVSTGTAGGQLFRGEGTTYVPWGTGCLPGWTTSYGSIPAMAGITFCSSPSSVSPAVDYVIGGNWSSYSGAVLNNVGAFPVATPYENDRQCLGCHYHQNAAGTTGTAYLLTGHKNALRKIPAGSAFQQWAGPDGNPYNTTDAYYGTGSTFNWSAGTVNVDGCDISTRLPVVGLNALVDSGCLWPYYGEQNVPLYYLFGGWMYYGGNSTTGNPHINTVFGLGATSTSGGFTGEQYPDGNFDCGRCHATGYNFQTAGTSTGTLASTGAPTFAGPEPTIQTSTTGTGTYTAITDAQMQRWPSDMGSGSDSSWYLTGVMCERCHIAEASYLTGPGNYVGDLAVHEGYSNGGSNGGYSQGMVLPTDQLSTGLCIQCHRSEAITTGTGTSGTIQPTYPPVATDTGYCSDLSLKTPTQCTAGWIYRPVIAHAQGTEFLNGPHAEFTGTVTQNTQNSADLSVNIVGTYGATLPTPEGSYFVETSGANIDQNKGCTGCHDPHFTTVVTPAQWNANNALYHTLQGVAQTNCTSCHGEIATNIFSTIKHPVGMGTPFPTGTDADIPGACVICHMQAASPNPSNPTQGVPQNHFFRINVSSSYYTYPQAGYNGSTSIPLNTATDPVTGFTGAIWNDVDIACGQCHTGGSGNGAPNPYGIAQPNPAPPAFTRTYLAAAANGIHGNDGDYPTASTPTFTPTATTYTSAQTVTIADTTSGATICYTTNGITPTAPFAGKCQTTGETYTGPFIVADTATVQAIATAPGYLDSAVGSAAYTINVAATPTFSPVAGNYVSPQSVTITSTTSGDSICYNIGAPPVVTGGYQCTTGTPLANGGQVFVSSTETIYAVAMGTSSSPNNSATTTTASGAYIIATLSAPVYSPAATNFTSTHTVSITSTNGTGYPSSVTICYTTNGTTVPTATVPGTCDSLPSEGEFASGSTLNVSASETLAAIATYASYTNSYATAAAYTVSTAVAGTPAFSPAAGSYTGPQTVTVTSATTGATICYTLDGSIPTATTPGTCNTSSTEFSMANKGTVVISQTGSLTAIATLAGDTNSAAAGGAYTIGNSGTVSTPSFSPAAGTYATPQTVTISDSTSGATICYTTNGSTPAASGGTCTNGTGVSTGYKLPVSASEQVQAMAFATSYLNSAVTGANYLIAPAAPTFSPVGGTYTGAQTVTITSTTAAASICYTTNGSTPTASTPGTCDSNYGTEFSLANGGSMVVSASETVEAIATLAGALNSGGDWLEGTNSTVASAAYFINQNVQAARPSFSEAGGIYYTPQTVTLSDTTSGATICYTTFAPTNNSPTLPYFNASGVCQGTVYTAGIGMSVPTVIAALAGGPGFNPSVVVQKTYTIKALTPSLSPTGGTYVGAQTVTITNNPQSPSATIYYNVNAAPSGTSPSCSSPCTGVVVPTSEVLEAVASYDLALLSESNIASATYNIVAAKPTFSPAPGLYKTPQTVTLADATPGVTICYTTNGTTPAVNSAGVCAPGSTTYTAPIPVSVTTTIEAVAGGSGYGSSEVVSKTYTIE